MPSIQDLCIIHALIQVQLVESLSEKDIHRDILTIDAVNVALQGFAHATIPPDHLPGCLIVAVPLEDNQFFNHFCYCGMYVFKNPPYRYWYPDHA